MGAVVLRSTCAGRCFWTGERKGFQLSIRVGSLSLLHPRGLSVQLGTLAFLSDPISYSVVRAQYHPSLSGRRRLSL